MQIHVKLSFAMLVVSMHQSFFSLAAAQVGPYADNATITPFGSASCASPVTQTLNVPDSFIIVDIDFRIQIQHTWRTDTNLALISPAGTRVDLLTGPYGQPHENYVVLFDDDAGVVVDTGIHDTSQLLTDPVVPVVSEGDLLSDFNGEDAQGDWSIEVCDVFTVDEFGEIRQVELFFIAAPELTALKTAAAYVPGDYSLPGSDMIYNFTISNIGGGPSDADTILLIDNLPSEITFYNGDIDDGGPLVDAVAFSQSGAGLSFDYATDVGFSNAATRPTDFSGCTYSPLAGYDPMVTFICINPKGAMLSGDPDPSVSISFRARIK